MIDLLLICTALVMHDGDSGRCHTANEESVRVRLVGIDTGEVAPFQRCRKQPRIWACTTGRASGEAATQRARALAAGGAVCRVVAEDRYHRLVAKCEAAGGDIGQTLLDEGLAVRFEQ